MNEAVTKRFLLYFRLMLLVWILIVNAILHVVGFAYSWHDYQRKKDFHQQG